jgi:hypothetical protein
MKVKVFNKNKFDVGIKLINPVREQNIKAGSFTIIDEDDVYYLDSTCTLFKRSILTIENVEINEQLGYVESLPLSKSDQEIQDMIKGNFVKMKSDLSKITEPHLKYAIYNVAKKMANELSGAKLKFLNEYCGRQLLDD